MSKREWDLAEFKVFDGLRDKYLVQGFKLTLSEEKVLKDLESFYRPVDNIKMLVDKLETSEAREAQLVELLRSLVDELNTLVCTDEYGCIKASPEFECEALEKARAKLTELNISTEEG